MGFKPQKLVHRALEKSSAAVKTWVVETYPAIRARAKGADAAIHWVDETGGEVGAAERPDLESAWPAAGDRRNRAVEQCCSTRA